MDTKDKDAAAFKKYLETVHPEDVPQRNTRGGMSGLKFMQIGFGIFMIIVYVGMGLLLLAPELHLTDGNDWIFRLTELVPWAWMRIMVGIVLIIYGIWRAIRAIFHFDTYF